MIRALLFVWLACAAVPAQAQTAVPAPRAAPDPVRKQLGHDLAKLLNSEAAIMALADRALSADMPKALSANANVKALEEAHPGIVTAMVDAMRPLILEYLRGEIPGFWSTLSDFYAANLSESDLRATIAFYGSPTGTRIVELMVRGVDFTPLFREMVVKEQYDVSGAQLSSAVRPAAAQAVGQLTPAELAETVRFAATGAGRKVIALTPRAAQLAAAWANQPTPDLDARLEKAVIEAMEKFLGRKVRQ